MISWNGEHGAFEVIKALPRGAIRGSVDMMGLNIVYWCSGVCGVGMVVAR